MSRLQPLDLAESTPKEPFPAAIVATVLLVTCLAPLNATVVVVAVPRVLRDFNVPVVGGSLLVTSYLVVMAVLPPIGGRLGDHWGRRPALVSGLVLFGLAALGASTARGFDALIGWRVLQAAGAATAFPNAVALLRERVPAQRLGLSLGLFGAVIALSAAAGPLLGEVLTEEIGWRAAFWMNVPLVAAAAGIALITTRPNPASLCRMPANPARTHLPGTLAVLGNRTFVGAAVAMGLVNLAMYAALVGLPLLLAGPSAGLLLGALLGLAALTAPAAGRLTDGHGRRGTAAAGMAILAVGMIVLAILGGSAGLPAVTTGVVLAGAGLGASLTALQTAGLEAVPAGAAGAAAGFLAASRYVGGAAGSSLVVVLLAAAPLVQFGGLFALASAAALLALVAFSRLRSAAAPAGVPRQSVSLLRR